MKAQLLKMLMAIFVVLIPVLNFAQAPPLGTAAGFVLFSSVGAVTNTGITHLTGNVGSNSGSSTGFGNVDGVMHDGDLSSAQCAADLLIAYNVLNSAVPTFFPAPLLGNGATLVPGVYQVSGAATINLDLTLDGQGDANAVFIFQIQGSLSTGANTKVKLINGTLACNVFWKVEGLVSMATGTYMRGTIIANNAAITMSTLDTLEGRALTTTGAITVDGITAFMPLGCGVPVLTGPIPPTLASAECYTLFSSNGPVTNAGITHVTGDVGTNVGLTVGFDPLLVTGTIHPIPDVSTAQCASDLLIIYNYLNILPYDILLLYPAQFGNNLVLTPHTYLMNGACVLTNTVFLNAQGNPNAVFVIRISGALSTSTFSKVMLINGAQAKNVFWQVDGAVNISDYSEFRGSIICNNAAVTLTTGVNLEGRALLTNGALSTSAITATMPPGCGGTSSPAITTQPGNQTACAGSSAVFAVNASGTGLTYQWRKGLVNLSNGGNIAGATTSTLTISPVNMSDAATNYNVVVTGTYSPTVTSNNASLTVYPLSVPTITGTNSVCTGTTGIIYTTQTGMTAYTWTVSAGGTITAGATTNAITVTWNTAGAQSVGANYTNASGCTAAAPVSYPVTVNARPTVSITGPATVCAGVAGNVYTTQTGMSAYTWTVSAGGTITAGATTNAITVTWNTAGAQTIGVNYTNASGCQAATPASYAVTVGTIPVPTIAGPASVCVNSTGNVYTTQAGMTAYTWTVSAGGTITAGATTNAITVTWNTAGAQTIGVNYTNASGCTAAAPVLYPVTVNARPTVSITGPATVCAGVAGSVYTTQAGMTAYTWTVSAGGTITAGATTNAITVTWNTAGAQTIGVNYTNASGCQAATPASYAVTVGTVPVPTIAGPASVCVNSTGNVYTTQAGMTAYTWTVSAGGTITAGATTNAITVTWNTAGAKTVGVNYTNASGCQAATPASYAVTVSTIPVPTIAGPASVCMNTTGNVYTTQAGMTAYVWTISAGGAITAGTGTNAITVTWNTAGAQTIGVNYTNASGCQAATPASYAVTVGTVPVPTIAGSTSVCVNTTGNVYTTQTGMSNYVWTVSAGGTITAGGTSTSSSVTVTWNTAGTGTVTVSYTSPAGCAATTPASYAVTVNARPVPTMTGPTSICQGATGQVYATQAGMTNYIWTVSAGGTITAGAGTNSITVTWAGSGAQTVGVNYTNASGCSATNPGQLNVTVNPTPAPSINGPPNPCFSPDIYTYYTESGMSNYVWTVSAGGSIYSGQGTSMLKVIWNTTGMQTITLSYTSQFGCNMINPYVKNIMVNPVPNPAGTITGTSSVCAGATLITYTTTSVLNASSYEWTVPSGATIASGNGTLSIAVNFGASAVSGDVTVAGVNNCGPGIPSVLAVTVNPLPSAAGAITGQASVCQGAANVSYTVPMIAGATGYTWSLPPGATITNGANTNSIKVAFSNNASSGNITANGTNTCGNGTISPNFAVTVNPIPTTPDISLSYYTFTSSAPQGNQWYFNNTMIPGANAQTYIADQSGNYHVVVTLNGCPSLPSNVIEVFITGISTLSSGSFRVYPVPSDGRFTAEIISTESLSFTLAVYNTIGVKLYEETNLAVDGKVVRSIDLSYLPGGVYTIILYNAEHQAVRRVVINK